MHLVECASLTTGERRNIGRFKSEKLDRHNKVSQRQIYLPVKLFIVTWNSFVSHGKILFRIDVSIPEPSTQKIASLGCRIVQSHVGYSSLTLSRPLVLKLPFPFSLTDSSAV